MEEKEQRSMTLGEKKLVFGLLLDFSVGVKLALEKIPDSEFNVKNAFKSVNKSFHEYLDHQGITKDDIQKTIFG